MKKLLLSTAILGAATLPVWAQEQSPFREAPEAMDIRASSFMGMRVYATETANDATEAQGVQQGWEDIGEINDVVMNREGQVQAVLVDVGGFLGIGERQVAVSMDALRFVSDSATADQPEDFFLVMNATREQIENAPAYEGGSGDMNAEQAAQQTDQAIESGTTTAAAVGAAAGAAAGAAVGTAVQGAESAGQTAADAAGNAAQATGDAMQNAGQNVADAANGAAQATGNAVGNAGEAVANTAGDATQTVGTATGNGTENVADAGSGVTVTTDGSAPQTSPTEQEMATDQTAAAATGAAATPTEGENAQTADAGATAAATEDTATTDATTQTANTGTAATDQAATGEVQNTEMTSADTAARTPVAPEGFVPLGAADITAENLEGAAVYDSEDKRVGEVGDIVMSAEGQVQDLVVDVGGFLGIGEKPVALPLDSVDLLRAEGGDEVRVYVSQTEDELKNMQTYEAPAQ